MAQLAQIGKAMGTPLQIASRLVFRMAAAMALCLLLAACKEDVYSGLVERDVNEMLAVLYEAGIDASRQRGNDGLYSLRVEYDSVPLAIAALRNAGYPRETFQSIGDVFNSSGGFGTPFEQHNRYIHAMNQELSAAITGIEGVRSARVLVTAPPRGRFDRDPPRATASVIIHHDAHHDMRSDLPQIKLLVAHSLPNLDYDDVAVALFETSDGVAAHLPERDAATETAATISTVDYLAVIGYDWRAQSVGALMVALAIALALLAAWRGRT